MPPSLHPSSSPAGGVPSRALLRHHADPLRAALPGGLTHGNRVQLLVHGPDSHEAMCEAIDGARDHINLEACLVETDAAAQALVQRLVAKRRQGVKVHLLLEQAGPMELSPLTVPDCLERLQAAGAQLACPASPADGWPARLRRALRLHDHRKLLVVDGRVAFAGGINLASMHAPRPAAGPQRWQARHMPWRDSHLRVEGPLVGQLQQLFIDHWLGATGRRPYLAHYFPPPQHPGAQAAGVAAGGERRSAFDVALLQAVDAAQQRVCIAAPYFAPPPRLVAALCRAARRGVEVQLVLPGISDAWAPLQAGRARYASLLRAGVAVHERYAALLHTQAAVIDGVWATLGGSHLDWRCLRPNTELHVVVLDPAFAADVQALFADDLAHSRPVSWANWRRRGLLARGEETLARGLELFA